MPIEGAYLSLKGSPGAASLLTVATDDAFKTDGAATAAAVTAIALLTNALLELFIIHHSSILAYRVSPLASRLS